MMRTELPGDVRRVLEGVCVEGRRVAELGCRAVLSGLGVDDDRRPAHLDDAGNERRLGLRVLAREFGSFEVLVGEAAFAQWHRLLFARFLSENGLLIHPEFGAPVSLAECEELAAGLGEPDGWGVAGRFAAEILPGIFRLDDPLVGLRLAPESRLALEALVEGLPVEVFTSTDGLGWVYQFWQRDKKDEVNASERKIGGADLGPVTQLFTENYMVQFLLENSLGAWWAARHPNSPLLADWEFLRFDDDGAPAAGGFESWPSSVAEVTVMDPCCGSGHFLVEAFEMLWRMRAEEEGLDPISAQDAVLRDNLFGLELDPRCVQIAMFALALTAWKAGGGWRDLPIPNVACSGIAVKAPIAEWKALADGDERVEAALVRLHMLFRDADTLGSLIDPRRAAEQIDPTGQTSLDSVDWDDIAPLLETALAEETDDPTTAVLGANAQGLVRAANYLANTYTLICTNVPFLGRTRQGSVLRNHVTMAHASSSEDLAAAVVDRFFVGGRGALSSAVVMPDGIGYLDRLSEFRREWIAHATPTLVAFLGAGAFAGIGGEVVRVNLMLSSLGPNQLIYLLDASSEQRSKLCGASMAPSSMSTLLRDRKARLNTSGAELQSPLRDFAQGFEGMSTGDSPRYQRGFWEVTGSAWTPFQTAPESSTTWGGLEEVVLWENGAGRLSVDPGARVQGTAAWARPGVIIERMSSLRSCLYFGHAFQKKTVVVVPEASEDALAVLAFTLSGRHADAVRDLDPRIGLSTSVITDVPFDLELWRAEAERLYPDGLPEPWSDDATQWLFGGRPEVARTEQVLQVGVGRLLGFAWPEQADDDDLNLLADEDGIVCLPSVRGEAAAADRLEGLLAEAFGGSWSPGRILELLAASGSNKTSLDLWLRDEFFKAHCKLFKNRPFIWHIWDGRKDGFSALVNYHKLDRSLLESLTHSYLGDWIERQRAGVRDGTAGAEDRLAAAQDLQRRLELIAKGEAPYDIFVRWKSLGEQPVGWDPDLDDGVRLNVRPFVEAEVLRAKFNVKWGKDRGKNPDGSERLNDIHITLNEKATARG